MVVGGEEHEYYTCHVGWHDWVANTETRTGCGPTEDAAVRDLFQLLVDDLPEQTEEAKA